MTSPDDVPSPDRFTAKEVDQLTPRVPVTQAAWAFLESFYKQADLISAWPMVDPQLRLCWAQWWIGANQVAIETDGYDREEVARALVRQAGAHPLWEHFELVVLRDFRAAIPLDPATWGIGTAERIIDSTTEVLYVLREIPPGGIWQPGESRDVAPLVMRHSAGKWRVLNLGYEYVPEAGWPPALSGSRDGSEASPALTPNRSQMQRQNRSDRVAIAPQPDGSWERSHLEKFIRMTTPNEPATSSGSISSSGDRPTRADEDDVVRASVLIERILAQVTPTWREEVPHEASGGWQQHRHAAIRAVAVMDFDPETRSRLGDAPPSLDPSSLHPWVWDAARQLWSNGHLAEAVGAAARRVNGETQRKTGRRDVSEQELFQQTFSLSAPAMNKPRLRLWADDGSQTYKNVHRGAWTLAEGLFAAVRNPAAHEDGHEITVQEALEQLAAFSLLARWVDRARKITV